MFNLVKLSRTEANSLHSNIYQLPVAYFLQGAKQSCGRAARGVEVNDPVCSLGCDNYVYMHNYSNGSVAKATEEFQKQQLPLAKVKPSFRITCKCCRGTRPVAIA